MRIVGCCSTQIRILTLCLAVLGLGNACFAGMSFSVYTRVTASSDFSTLYNGVTVDDNSSGCSHGSYSTTRDLSSREWFRSF